MRKAAQEFTEMIKTTIVDIEGKVYGVKAFKSVEELGQGQQQLLLVTHNGLEYSYDTALIGMCECCDGLYLREHEVLGGRSGQSGFCSDICAREAAEDARIADWEAKREYELYGDDIDSWFR